LRIGRGRSYRRAMPADKIRNPQSAIYNP